MIFHEVVLGKVYWLVEGDQKIVRVVAVGIDDTAGTLTVRLPNGAMQEVFPDELEKA